MAKYYVTNANGDWWTMESGDTLYFISERDLLNIVGGADGLEAEADKLDRVIKLHGRKATPAVDLKDLD